MLLNYELAPPKFFKNSKKKFKSPPKSHRNIWFCNRRHLLAWGQGFPLPLSLPLRTRRRRGATKYTHKVFGWVTASLKRRYTSILQSVLPFRRVERLIPRDSPSLGDYYPWAMWRKYPASVIFTDTLYMPKGSPSPLPYQKMSHCRGPERNAYVLGHVSLPLWHL